MQAPLKRLEIKKLCHNYDGRAVVDDLSLSLTSGQVLCLLGPSGCGKSTTLRLIAGLETQTSGEIWIDGECVSKGGNHLPPERRNIGMMFQDFALFPHLSVGENVAFGLKGARREKRTRVHELLERVSLRHYTEAFPHELSGGEQQRVALARALAPNPRIMLMDEPFSGLDNRLRDGIRDETLEILHEEQVAVILVTHEPEEAMRMSDEIVLMREGQIIQKGAPYNIYNAPVDRDAVAFFSDINTLTGQVQGALVDTEFGQFLAPGLADGQKVDIVIRPQHIKIDFDRAGVGPSPTISNGKARSARVKRARFLGTESLVEFETEETKTQIKALVPNVFLPRPDTRMWVMIAREKCFIFPRQETPS